MAIIQASGAAWVGGSDVEEEEPTLGVQATNGDVGAAFGDGARFLVAKEIRWLGSWLESSLGAEHVEAVAGVVVRYSSMADAVEEVVA